MIALSRIDLYAEYVGGRYLPVIAVENDKLIVAKEDGTAKRATSVHGFKGVVTR